MNEQHLAQPLVVKEIPEPIQKELVNIVNKLDRQQEVAGKMPHGKKYRPYKSLNKFLKELRKKPFEEISDNESELLYKKTHETWHQNPTSLFIKSEKFNAEIILGRCLKMLSAINDYETKTIIPKNNLGTHERADRPRQGIRETHFTKSRF